MNGKKTLMKISAYLFLGAWTLFSLFPFYWLLVGSTNTTTDITKGRLLPGLQFLTNLKNLVATYDFWTFFQNTVVITVIYCVVCLFVCSLAAYGFALFSSKGKKIIFSLFLLMMMVPFSAQMIPLYRLMAKINLSDSFFAIILQGAVNIFLIFFLTQSFRSFPKEVIESARIDGASELKIFFRIVLPSMKSALAAGIIQAFMTQWNNYLWPLIILQSNSKKTLTLAISSMSTSYTIDYGMISLAILFATIPMIVIFILLQKQFVQGMTGSYR